MVPQSSALPVLITRPQPQAARFADQVRAAFGDTVDPVLSPLLAPRFLVPDLPEGRFGAVVLTSETGVQAAVDLRSRGASLPGLAFCVGDHTADIARTLGFAAQSAAGDVIDLLELLARNPQDAPFLHLRGQKTAGNLLVGLRAKGIAAQDCVIYAQDEKPLSAQSFALVASQHAVCVPLFSPRSARLFVAAVQGHPVRARLLIAAISQAVARSLPDGFADAITIADQPDAASMLGVIGQFRFNA